MTEFEAVFWDVGGVLLDLESVQSSHARFVGWLVDAHDLDATESEAVDTWRSVVGQHFRERDGTAFRSAQEGYHKAVEAILGEPVERDEWQRAMRSQIRDVVGSNPGARETIERVAGTGRHQGVVSDADHDELLWLLSHLGVREHFDAVTTSESVGRTKPDPAMFETALERSPAPPERTLMIGDRYGHDMEGAKRHDIRTAAYGAEDGPAVDYRLEDLRDVLEILGIED